MLWQISLHYVEVTSDFTLFVDHDATILLIESNAIIVVSILYLG